MSLLVLVIFMVTIYFLLLFSQAYYSHDIPKVIHKVFIEKKDSKTKMNPSQQKALDSWSTLNKGYKIKYWNRKSCEDYLKKNFPPIFFSTFDCIEAYSGKCNFFRYCVIYNEGGWYSDWKQTCLKENLLNKFKQMSSFVYFMDVGTQNTRDNKCVQPAFFGSVPKNPVMKYAMDIVIDNTAKKYYGRTPLHTTGPCVFGKAILLYNSSSKHPVEPFGTFHKNEFYDKNLKVVVKHKHDYDPNATNFGNQNWKNGNNYNYLWKEKKYYCDKKLES